MRERFETNPVRDLVHFRAALENPSAGEVSQMLDKVYPLVLSRAATQLTDPEEVLYVLSQNKADNERNGVEISRRQNCIDIVSNGLTLNLQELAALCKDNPVDTDRAYFKFFLDLSLGSGAPLASIMIAEDESEGLAEASRLASISDWNEVASQSLGDQAAGYLSLRRSNADAAKLLIADPSGFSLIKESIERVKNGVIFNCKSTREYFEAGAELAGDLYKKVYEFAAPLYPEKQ